MAFGDETRAWLAHKKAMLPLLLWNWAQKLEGYAKPHAPWTDRTGHARQSLHGGVEQRQEGTLVLYLSHGVEYGIYLELANGGKYAILGPTVDAHINRIRATVKELWED
ncbi:MAG: hypothetical protein A6D91_04700 [Bacillaceae bacterium G1]|nr:MAG: hypothetical protein A6D91_04700 [Bacillaceae bacterium G1]